MTASFDATEPMQGFAIRNKAAVAIRVGMVVLTGIPQMNSGSEFQRSNLGRVRQSEGR